MQLPADRKNAYSYEELLSCANGTLFKPESGRLPLPDMLMTDRVNLISETGGKYDK
jgi:3-hydroxyacyl-[acyl-carrier protein] dehydratase/trans-2-decenoyl-[acyl-carrier protein] isomerase